MKIASLLPDPPSNFTIESSLANELLKLSFKDRNELEEEMHGVHCGAAKESPEFLEHSLSEFDLELNARKEKVANSVLLRNVIHISSLDEAAAKSAKLKCYLNDPDIRLRFLRCERFDVQKAVQRLVNFLDFSSEIYGDFVANRPISISDFNSKEETALQNSRCQYLPFRDRSGRRVSVGVGTANFDLDIKLRCKINLYLHWVVSEDIETQRKGIVLVAWIFDEREDKTWQKTIRPAMKKSLASLHGKEFNSIPLRIASLKHFYLQDTAFFRSMATLYFFHLSTLHRKYYKNYFGNHTELLYKLSSFGVPPDLLPVSCTGKVKFSNHSSFINFQRSKLIYEQNITGEEIVECPRSEDVVFKKGPGYKNNPGNWYYRGLIESAGYEHQNAEREEKYQITLRIVDNVEEINGRFLEWSKGKKMWIVNKDRSKIRAKVASTLKQYNRHKAESQQLEQLHKTIRNAEDINHSVKRRKIMLFCDDGKITGTSSDDNFCFGKTFYPTK